MNSSFKQAWLDMAEVVDAWRVFPRGFFVLFLWMLFDGHTWFTGIGTPTPEQKWYLATLWGAVGLSLKFYLDTGRKWDK